MLNEPGVFFSIFSLLREFIILKEYFNIILEKNGIEEKAGKKLSNFSKCKTVKWIKFYLISLTCQKLQTIPFKKVKDLS